MAIISDSFIEVAIKETTAFSNPKERSQAVRIWLHNQGFSTDSITDSEPNIVAAVTSALGEKRSVKTAPETQSQRAKRQEPSTPKPTANEPIGRRLRILLPLFALSSVCAFLLAPGNAPLNDLPRFLLTATAISFVAFLIGTLLWKPKKPVSSQGIVLAIVTALAPAVVFGISVSERHRATSDRFVPTLFSERGIQSVKHAIAMFGVDPSAQVGTVDWYNETKGFGFISSDASDDKVFLHVSALERSGLSSIGDNQLVMFVLETGRDGRTSATQITLLD